MLAMPVVWDERCRLHEPGAEIFVGVRTPGTETPDRADALLAALGEPVLAEPHDDGALLAVHDAALVEFLASAWNEWAASGLPKDPGQDRVVPYVFSHEKLGARREPVATWARPGSFALRSSVVSRRPRKSEHSLHAPSNGRASPPNT